MHTRFSLAAIVTALLVVLFLVPAIYSQEVSRSDRNAVKSIATAIDRAGRQYRGKKFESAGEYFAQANEAIQGLAEGASPELMQLIEPEHARLSRAHELLTAEGIELAAIAPLPEPFVAGEGEQVSFGNDVAPIIVANCGRCHVQRARGDFSAATFRSLIASGYIAAGKPNRSRFIEVIVDGEMPPGGELTEEDLNALKTWILQGAKFDGDANANLAQLARAAGDRPADEPERPTVKKATGEETVSFGADVAPVLVENCATCHVNPGNNPSGGLNMTNFNLLLRGGDSGPIIQPGKGKTSLLVMKLRGMGEGQQMPLRQPALDEAVIAKIATWIDEGASFDGGDPQISMPTIAARAKAQNMSHAELSEQRKQVAAGNWQTVMSSAAPSNANRDDVFVVSSYDQADVDAIADMTQAISVKIKNLVKAPKGDPLVKGRVTAYVFQRRYDFSEFGLMVEGRELPKAVSSRWGFNVTDANMAFLLSRNQAAADIEGVIARELGSVYISSLAPDVPKWFASGMGYWIASKVTPRAPGVDEWSDAAEAAAEEMAKPDDFIRGQLPNDQAALVSYYFVTRLRSSSSGKFSKLLDKLKADTPFPVAFQEVYGTTPQEYVGGEKPGQGRQRRRRR